MDNPETDLAICTCVGILVIDGGGIMEIVFCEFFPSFFFILQPSIDSLFCKSCFSFTTSPLEMLIGTDKGRFSINCFIRYFLKILQIISHQTHNKMFRIIYLSQIICILIEKLVKCCFICFIKRSS